MDKPLVSIIIPTYNRAHLIGETLDSILAQSYTTWECIVVDDGSSDDTDGVMAGYCNADSRIKYYHRPDAHLQGGNGARNYGLELAKGRYIQFFDSDDLMTPNAIAIKASALDALEIDLVIAKTDYLNGELEMDYTYPYTEDDISFESYAIDHVSWFTPDSMYRAELLGVIRFNENLKAGQEYNFNCKVLLNAKKVSKIDKVLTLRRAHEGSIGQMRKENRFHYLNTKFASHWCTYLDCHQVALNSRFDRYSLLQCVLAYLKSRNQVILPTTFNVELKSVFGSKWRYFKLAALLNRLTGRYYYFYAKLKGSDG